MTKISILKPAAIGLAMICVPAAVLANAHFQGASQQGELDCDGGAAIIEGASNTFYVTGACTSLDLQGADNTIYIDLAANSTITVEGAANEVRWTAPGSSKPRLNITGADNRVFRDR